VRFWLVPPSADSGRVRGDAALTVKRKTPTGIGQLAVIGIEGVARGLDLVSQAMRSRAMPMSPKIAGPRQAARSLEGLAATKLSIASNLNFDLKVF
jgi:hypothetical protein